jgi:preprotein translocase subunit SecG
MYERKVWKTLRTKTTVSGTVRGVFIGFLFGSSCRTEQNLFGFSRVETVVSSFVCLLPLLLIIISIILYTELSHQQSREIEYHHARAGRQTQGPPHPSLVAAQDAALRSAAEISRVASVFYGAAAGAWKEHQEHASERARYRRVHINENDNTTAFLDDFGIPKEDDYYNGNGMGMGSGMEYTSFADQEHQQQQQQPSSHGAHPPPPSREQDDFVFLERFRLRPRADGWGAVANLDQFFSSLYNYYYQRGLVPILANGVVQLVTLFFTLCLSVFLFAYVDWRGLSSCIDESTCHSDFIEDYLVKKPFSRWSLWNAIVILYCLLFFAYGIFSSWAFYESVLEALQAKYVFEDRLGINARKLQGGAVDWDRDVVTKLLELQQSGEYRIAIHGQDLDALVVAQRILRKEAFLVALFNRQLLDLSVPGLGNTFCASLEVGRKT